MEDAIAACQRVLSFGNQETVDEYTQKQLREAVLEHTQRRRHVLADVFFTVGGKMYKSLMEALCEAEPGTELSIGLYHPDLTENWDYDTPTKAMMIGPKGAGIVEHFHYDPYSFEKWNFNERFKKSRGMFMGHFTSYFIPETIKQHTVRMQEGRELAYDPRLRPFDELHAELRTGRVVPFGIRLCAYTQQARHSFTIDLLNNVLVRDFRAGKLPPKGRVFRPPLDCLAFDRVFASEKLTETVANAFIMVFERSGTTVFDVSQVIGLNEASARNTLGALTSRGLVRREGAPPRETYEVDMDLVRKLAEQR